MSISSYPDPAAMSLLKMDSELKDEKLIDNPNYAYAEEAHKLIGLRFPYGAFNRVDVVEKLGIRDEELKHFFKLGLRFHSLSLACANQDGKVLAEALQPMMLGYCSLFVSYAIAYLKNKYPASNPGVLFEWVSLDDHVVLAIGRRPDSNPRNINDWGNKAVICDLWAGQSYLAADFFKWRAIARPIPYYTDRRNREDNAYVKSSTHFLSGQPVVSICPFLELEESLYKSWILEDQRRWALAFPKIPKTPLAAIDNSEPSAVKNALNQLTGTVDGWKFKRSTGIAWYPCENAAHAERQAYALAATKAMLVKISSTTDEKKPKIYGVKCEHIQLDKLRALVEALDPAKDPTLNFQDLSDCSP